MRIILASASPRRRELLSALVDGFEVFPADVEEVLGDDPQADAVRLAVAKAAAISLNQDALVIGSDTVVHDGQRPYGKPETEVEAVSMLQALRGRAHTVITGVAVLEDGRVGVGASRSKVWLSSLADGVIDAYVASGRPMDKAGAYAIQDEDVPTVSRLDGCYCNVVGLPLWRLRALLESNGVICKDPGQTFSRCNSCPDRLQSARSNTCLLRC